MTSLKDQELEKLIDSKDKSFILFSADWCGPCKIIKPTLEKVSEEFQNEFNFAKADVGEAEKTTKKFGIKNIPTCVITSEGKEIARFSGVKSEDDIKKFLEQNLN
jgi:thioredoxin 1